MVVHSNFSLVQAWLKNIIRAQLKVTLSPAEEVGDLSLAEEAGDSSLAS